MHKNNILTFVLPVIIFLSQFIAAPFMTYVSFYAESGPLEMLQAAVVSVACLIAAYLAFKVKDKMLSAWAALAALCCFYVAGEELSWGQWLFHWTTPQEWAAINDQNETNFHNTSAWFDQKPRMILEIGVLVGGLIIPALRKWKPARLPAQFSDIYPDNIVVFTAMMALVIKIINFAGDVAGSHFFWRGSEVMELMLYYFVLLYLIGLTRAWTRKGLV